MKQQSWGHEGSSFQDEPGKMFRDLKNHAKDFGHSPEGTES